MFLYILGNQIKTFYTTKSNYNVVRYIYILCTLIFITLTAVIFAIDLGILHLWLEYWIARAVLFLLAITGIFLFKIYKGV